MRYWTFSDYSQILVANRTVLQRIFFSLALFTLCLNIVNHQMISQIGANPLLNQDVDPVYLAFMAAGVPQFLSGWPALYFDILLIASCLCSLVWTRQWISPMLFLILYFIYFVCYNMLSGHHYTNVGLLIMSLPFVFTGNGRFATAFNVCRFFLCFMMFSAACWKIARGNLWHVDQTNMMLITTHLETLAANTYSSAADNVYAPAGENVSSTGIDLLRWLIAHKTAAHTIWIILIFLEGLFIVGFITYRWDKLLLIAYLLFFIGGWLIFRIYNFENLLLLLTLTPLLTAIQRSRKLLRPKSNTG